MQLGILINSGVQFALWQSHIHGNKLSASEDNQSPLHCPHHGLQGAIVVGE
jgi:hypothetical protein